MTSNRIPSIAILAAAAVLSTAGAASAAKVDLKGRVVTTYGSARLKVEDFGTCYSRVRFTVQFADKGRKFTAWDIEGRQYKGKYEQKGRDGRKIEFKLTSGSRRELTRAMETEVQRCTGARKAEADIDKLRLGGKIDRSQTMMKMKGLVEGDGKADGDEGEAVYKFSSSGRM